jgi:ABC-2 type transport system ATP-binding protein
VEFIQLKEVCKDFGPNKVLRDVNITIEEGDIVGVIGQSGSGKTTLLNLVTGYLNPNKGNILYYPGQTTEPINLSENLSKIKKHIGYTPQHNSFYPKLTVEENLIHFGKMYKVSKVTLMNNIRNLLEVTKLSNHNKKMAEHLSGGMQKRLDISCSLVHKPKLLVLDEPTADLDLILQKEILEFLQAINKQGVTIIIASHDLEGIEKICNKIVMIHNSKVHSYGMLEEVRRPFLKKDFTINVHNLENKEIILSLLQKLPVDKIIDQGSTLKVYPQDAEKTISRLIRLIKEENLYLHDLDIRKPTLNEIFEKVSTQE